METAHAGTAHVATAASAVRRGRSPAAPVSAHFMRNKSVLYLTVVLLLTSCSPRDFLTRRLAGDLISNSDFFKGTQSFILQTGVVSNKDYLSPENMVLQRRGWINGTNTSCPQGLGPAPCWDVLLTPSGVETIRTAVSQEEAQKPAITIPVARRALVRVSGISKQGIVADVEFTWKWVPLNEIGAALYSGDVHYRSTVGFRQYDDGWRVSQSAPRARQTLDDALKSAEPAP